MALCLPVHDLLDSRFDGLIYVKVLLLLTQKWGAKTNTLPELIILHCLFMTVYGGVVVFLSKPH